MLLKRVTKILNPFSSINYQMKQANSEVALIKSTFKATWSYYSAKRSQLKQIKSYFSKDNYQEAKKIYSLPSPFFDETIKIIDKDYLVSLLEEYIQLSQENFSIQIWLYENTRPHKYNNLRIDDFLIWDLITETIVLREGFDEFK